MATQQENHPTGQKNAAPDSGVFLQLSTGIEQGTSDPSKKAVGRVSQENTVKPLIENDIPKTQKLYHNVTRD